MSELCSMRLFETKARVFYKMTGHLAPGKDRPAALGPCDEDAVRQAWSEWNTAYGPFVRGVLEAELEVCGNGDQDEDEPTDEPDSIYTMRLSAVHELVEAAREALKTVERFDRTGIPQPRVIGLLRDALAKFEEV